VDAKNLHRVTAYKTIYEIYKMTHPAGTYSLFIYDTSRTVFPRKEGCYEPRGSTFAHPRELVCYELGAKEVRDIPSARVGTILAKNKEDASERLQKLLIPAKPTSCVHCERYNAAEKRNPEIITLETLAANGDSETIKNIPSFDIYAAFFRII
jgi:hypothetical protein